MGQLWAAFFEAKKIGIQPNSRRPILQHWKPGHIYSYNPNRWHCGLGCHGCKFQLCFFFNLPFGIWSVHPMLVLPNLPLNLGGFCLGLGVNPMGGGHLAFACCPQRGTVRGGVGAQARGEGPGLGGDGGAAAGDGAGGRQGHRGPGALLCRTQHICGERDRQAKGPADNSGCGAHQPASRPGQGRAWGMPGRSLLCKMHWGTGAETVQRFEPSVAGPGPTALPPPQEQPEGIAGLGKRATGRRAEGSRRSGQACLPDQEWGGGTCCPG
jgi:hypothetical protein